MIVRGLYTVCWLLLLLHSVCVGTEDICYEDWSVFRWNKHMRICYNDSAHKPSFMLMPSHVLSFVDTELGLYVRNLLRMVEPLIYGCLIENYGWIMLYIAISSEMQPLVIIIWFSGASFDNLKLTWSYCAAVSFECYYWSYISLTLLSRPHGLVGAKVRIPML